MLDIKNTVIEIKNAFNILIHRLDTAKERISEHEHISIETSQIEMHRQKRIRITEQTTQGLWDNCKRCNIGVMEIPEGEGRKV